MKHKRFSDEQVIGVLKEHEAGAKVDDLCRRHAISSATFYTWRKKYGGMEASDAKRLRELEAVGVGLRPFSVAHVEQPWRRPRTPGDLTIRWTRRSRSLAADNWGAADVPLAEETEAYEVEILDGVTVKRVLSTATTSALYTAAQQTADWGGPLGPGDSLAIRIFQLSALIGRGAPKTVTLTF